MRRSVGGLGRKLKNCSSTAQGISKMPSFIQQITYHTCFLDLFHANQGEQGRILVLEIGHGGREVTTACNRHGPELLTRH